MNRWNYVAELESGHSQDRPPYKGSLEDLDLAITAKVVDVPQAESSGTDAIPNVNNELSPQARQSAIVARGSAEMRGWTPASGWEGNPVNADWGDSSMDMQTYVIATHYPGKKAPVQYLLWRWNEENGETQVVTEEQMREWGNKNWLPTDPSRRDLIRDAVNTTLGAAMVVVGYYLAYLITNPEMTRLRRHRDELMQSLFARSRLGILERNRLAIENRLLRGQPAALIINQLRNLKEDIEKLPEEYPIAVGDQDLRQQWQECRDKVLKTIEQLERQQPALPADRNIPPEIDAEPRIPKMPPGA